MHGRIMDDAEKFVLETKAATIVREENTSTTLESASASSNSAIGSKIETTSNKTTSNIYRTKVELIQPPSSAKETPKQNNLDKGKELGADTAAKFNLNKEPNQKINLDKRSDDTSTE